MQERRVSSGKPDRERSESVDSSRLARGLAAWFYWAKDGGAAPGHPVALTPSNAQR